MSKFIDITGKKFGMLTVVKKLELNKYKQSVWLCGCECGGTSEVCISNLKSGNTKSCGCLNKKLVSKRRKTHGMRNSNEYGVWVGMKSRCLNNKSKGYKYYGGKGIKVCDRWLKFENFYEDMGDRPQGLTLDRIDNDQNYCKENCRWATWKEQANNRRNNIKDK